jgi:hypothetical protein
MKGKTTSLAMCTQWGGCATYKLLPKKHHHQQCAVEKQCDLLATAQELKYHRQ